MEKRGPAMESQGTGAGGEARREGGGERFSLIKQKI